mmetsp:Transcript_6169/g.13502  ORF Transcript_6169/g.13502 Transcript_6169/m.13502 type:complete len:290 (-) Transcript_6169:165-1034(-)
MTLLTSELCWRFGYRCVNSLQTPALNLSTRIKMFFFSSASSSSSCHHGESSPRLPFHRITNTSLINSGTRTTVFYRSYFTNTEELKKFDPYAALGLTWGATTTEIKAAYHRLARELHPDVSDLDPVVALNKFRVVRDSYDKLMNNKNSAHRSDLWEEWSFAVWRSGDMIAQERKDVAGVMRKRPVRPAESLKKGKGWGIAALGHPDGRGNMGRRGGEYLADRDESRKSKSSTVGTGKSKWVSQKEFQPWKPDQTKLRGVSGLKSMKTAEKVKHCLQIGIQVTRLHEQND